MTAAVITAGSRRSGPDLPDIYLNDRLAGATGGVELARRAAGSQGNADADGALQNLAAEIAQDRAALLNIMAALGIVVRSYKVRVACRSKPPRGLRYPAGTAYAQSHRAVHPVVTDLAD
jgi:hypothetical protein